MTTRGTPGHFEGVIPVAGSSTGLVGGSEVPVVEVAVTAVDDVVDV
jgi:hypothetical protein